MELENSELQKAEMDKRRFRRARLITQVTCEALGREAVAVSRDISVGGMFLNDPEPFPKKSVVSLVFRLSPTDPVMTCEGEVVYSIKGVGMGVMFTEVSPEVRQALEKFVSEAN